MNFTIAMWAGIAVIVFCCSFLLVLPMLSRRSGVEERLREVTEIAAPPNALDEDEQEKPGAFAAISSSLRPVLQMLGLAADPIVTGNLAKIGYTDPHYQDMYYAAKLLGPALAAVLAGTIFTSDPLFAFFAMGAVSFFIPDLWLSSQVSKWREAIRLALPDALDLLVITMEAGLGLDQALLRVAVEMKTSHPELARELTLINLEQRAGERRLEAWQHMADRTELDTVRAFVNMLLQTERFGTPVATALGNFADGMRVQRRQKAEEMAAKTTIKLIFPLVMFIFPSMFIVLLAPAIIAIVENLKRHIQ